MESIGMRTGLADAAYAVLEFSLGLNCPPIIESWAFF